MRQHEFDQCTEQMAIAPEPCRIRPVEGDDEFLRRLIGNGAAAERGIEHPPQPFGFVRLAVTVEVEPREADGDGELDL